MTALRPLFLLAVLASVASAQVEPRSTIADSSVAQIMARVGGQPGAPWFLDILRQTDGNVPTAKLDELGDSLVARAIDSGAVEPTSQRHTIALNAAHALALAGTWASTRGRPYAGALDRLITVHRTAASRRIRVTALASIPSVPGSETRGIEYLTEVAASKDETVWDAVEFLVPDANGGSWTGATPPKSQQQRSGAALRALAAGNRVTDTRAVILLEGWVSRNP